MVTSIVVGVGLLIFAAALVYFKRSARSSTAFKLEAPKGRPAVRPAPPEPVETGPSPADAKVIRELYFKIVRLEAVPNEAEVKRVIDAERRAHAALSERALMETVYVNRIQLKLINRYSGNRAAMERQFGHERAKSPHMTDVDVWELIYQQRGQVRG